MANAMDERVVSMQFDNKQFEKNVRSSMDTIDNLKNSLDFSKSTESIDALDSAFQKFGKKNSFKDVNSYAATLQGRLESLKTSTGGLVSKFLEMTQFVTLLRTAESAVRSLESTIKQFTIAPITEGYTKFNTKIASIKTISNATEMAADKVNESLDRLNWFTDETSASFGEMVNNIGKFTSVGKGLDESITAMEGIATWGYQSGANVAEINRAMYNLSQAMGQGSVKLMDWKSIENAGMATKEFKEQAIAAAEAAGTLKRKNGKLFAGKQEVNTSNFNSTLAKGWFTSSVLMDTLEVYGGFADTLKAYQEKHPNMSAAEAMAEMDLERENKQLQLFSDNYEVFAKKTGKSAADLKQKIDAVQKMGTDTDQEKKARTEALADLVKTLGVDSLDEIFEIHDEKERAKKIKAFAKEVGLDVKDATTLINELAECEESLGEKAFKSSQQSKSLEDAINATKDAVSTGWMNTFQHIFGGLDESIKLWTDVTDILWDLFAAGGDARNNAFKYWSEQFEGREDLWGDDGILHSIMDTVIELKELFGTSIKDVFFKDLHTILGMNIHYNASNLVGKFFTEDQLQYAREGQYFGAQIKNITSAIKDFGIAIRDFFQKEGNMDKVSNVFRGFLSVVQLIGSVVSNIFSTIGRVIGESGVVQDILDVASNVGLKIEEIAGKIKNSEFINTLFRKIGNTIVWLYNLVKGWGTQIASFFENSGLLQGIKDWFSGILEYFTGSEKDVDENGNKLESAFFRSFAWIGDIKSWLEGVNLESALNKVKTFIDHFSTIWATFTGAMSGQKYDRKAYLDHGASGDLISMLDTAQNFGEKLSSVGTFISDTFTNIATALETSGILPTIRSAWDGIKLFFSNLGLVWEVLTTGKVADPDALDENQTALVDGIISFVKSLESAFDQVKGWFNDAIAWVKELYGQVVGWLESNGILPAIRAFWDDVKTFFENIGLMWDYFVKGKALDWKSLSPKQQKLLQGVGKFFAKIRNLGAKLKDWFDTAIAWVKETWGVIVDWLETSGVLPKVRTIWKTVTDFFTNIGLLWDIFVTKQGKYDPKDLTEDQLSIVQKIENFINKVKEKFEWIKQKFTQIKNTVVGWLEDSGILPTLRNWWTEITGWFDSLKVPTGEDSPLGSVQKFFSDLYSSVSGWFGGGEQPKPQVTKPNQKPKQGASPTDAKAQLAEEKAAADAMQQKTGVFASMFANIKNAFTDQNGNLDLIGGFAASIGEVLKDVSVLVGAIDLKPMLQTVTGVLVDSINALDDAAGKVHIDNILSLIQKIAGATALVMLVPTLNNIFTTIRTIAKKGKEKSGIEKATDLLSAIGTMLLQMGIAIALIAASIWLIGQLKTEDLWKGVGVLAALVLLFGVLLVYVGKLSKSGLGLKNNKTAETFKAVGAMFLNLGIAIGLIVASLVVLTILTRFDFGHLAAAFGELVIIMGLMLLFLKIASKITQGNTLRISAGIAAFAGIAILIGTITVCLLLLQAVDFGKALLDLVLLGLAMAGMVAALHFISKAKVSAKMLAPLIVMTVAIGIITAAFLLLQNVDPDTMLNAATSIGIVLMAMAGAVLLLQNVSPKGALQAALAMGAIITALVAALAISSSVAAGAANTIADAVASVTSTLGAASISSKSIDQDAILAALDLLPKINQRFNSITTANTANALTVASDAWTVLIRLGLANASAVAIDVSSFNKIFGEDGKGGVLAAITTGLSSVQETGQQALTLGGNLETFAGSLLMLDEAGSQLAEGTNIQNIKDRLGDIQAVIDLAAKLNKPSDGSGGEIDLTYLSTSITNVGTALQLYNKAVKEKTGMDDIEVPDITTDNVKKALENLVAALPDTLPSDAQRQALEGWGGMETGENGQTLFALGLVAIADAMTIFSEHAADFVSSNSQKAIESLQTLKSIGSEIPTPSDYNGTIDGIKGWEVGYTYQNGTFANSIVKMGLAMAAFGRVVKNIPENSVTNATTALETFVAIYHSLTDNKAVFQEIKTGAFNETISTISNPDSNIEETFRQFGEGIARLGSGLSSFSTALTSNEGYDATKVQEAVGILTALGDLEVAIRTSKMTVQWWQEDENLETFGKNFSGLGAKLSQFSTELAGFNIDTSDATGQKWKDVKNVLEFLKQTSIDLGTIGGAVKQEGWSDNFITEVAYDLGDLAEDINTLSQYIGPLVEATTSFMDKGLQEGNFYDLANFGEDLKSFFFSLNGGMGNLLEIIGKLHPTDGATVDVNAFVTFMDALKKLAEATGILHGQQLDKTDIQNLQTLIQSLVKLDASGLNAEAFNAGGLNMATQFFNGFKQAFVSTTEEGEVLTAFDTAMRSLMSSIDTYVNENMPAKGKWVGEKFMEGFASIKNGEGFMGLGKSVLATKFDQVLSAMDGIAQQFYDKGKTAGEKYAEGFKAGLGDTSKLVPVVDMDQNKQNNDSFNGVNWNGFNPSDALTTVLAHIDAANKPADGLEEGSFNNDVLYGLARTNEHLSNLNSKVTSLSSQVNNLKVFINSKILVGAIAADMDRELGRRGNMRNVSP